MIILNHLLFLSISLCFFFFLNNNKNVINAKTVCKYIKYFSIFIFYILPLQQLLLCKMLQLKQRPLLPLFRLEPW